MNKTTNESKKKNIIEMSLTFSAMMRVFEKGSSTKIAKELYRHVENISHSNSKIEFENFHKDFCEWFTKNIKKSKNGTLKECASFGQAAKVIDIALKVYFYYCKLPSDRISSKIIPWLNVAIDTKILNDLQTRYPNLLNIHTNSIAQIDEEKYYILQKIILKDIENLFEKRIYPVAYDDIRWRKLNKQI